MEEDKKEGKVMTLIVQDARHNHKAETVSLMQFRYDLEWKFGSVVVLFVLNLANCLLGYYLKSWWSILICFALNGFGIWVGLRAFIKVQKIVT
jgi:uncharacterized ion transporter superfamily protein YfcC